jgi:phage gp46-like protein
MSDIYLNPTADGADIAIDNGKLRTTSALEVAVYLALFTPETWQDMPRDSANRYTSRIPEIMRGQTVSNRTRIALMQAAVEALAWMIRDGIADEVVADAAVVSSRRIDLTVTITRPDGGDEFAYALNWDAQNAELLEATT